uniref:Uncharacterized protein n=1 Tax=Rhizophora mucronata TaxID=61149 RepID=A0A2P2PRP3_RHIMU
MHCSKFNRRNQQLNFKNLNSQRHKENQIQLPTQ